MNPNTWSVWSPSGRGPERGPGRRVLRLLVRPASLAVLLCCLGSSSCAATQGSGGAGAASRATIDRDEFGVPYIVAEDEAAGVHALAWAMAEDGFYELEDAYAAALGRAAGYYGVTRQPDDVLRVSLQVNRRAQEELASLPTAERELLQAYVDGLNGYIRAHPDQPPRQIALFEPWMVIAYANEVTWVRAAQKAADGGAPGVGAAGVAAAGSTPVPSLVLRAGADRAAGSALFLVASFDERPYEYNVRTSDGWAFHGIATLGLPFAREGYNARIAYGRGAESVDGEIATAHASSAQLLANDTIRLNTAAGVVRVPVASRRTADGAIIGVRGVRGDQADSVVVLRPSGAQRGVLRELHALMHATDSSGAARAMKARGADAPLFLADAETQTSSLFSFAPGEAARQAAVDAALHAESAWTIQKLIRLAFDARIHGAGDEIAAVTDEWEQVGALNPEKAQLVDSAIAMLRSWNRMSEPDSRVMTLYAAYRAELGQSHPGSYRRFAALEAVVQDRRRFPPQPWGIQNAVRRGPTAMSGGVTAAPGTPVPSAMPVAGAPVEAGTIFTFDARRTGQFYVWAIDLKSGVAGSVLSMGNAYRTASPHWFDQATLFAAGSLKPSPAAGAGRGNPYRPGDVHEE